MSRFFRYIIETEDDLKRDGLDYKQAVLDLKYSIKSYNILKQQHGPGDPEEKTQVEAKLVTLQKKIMSLKEKLKGMSTSEDVKDLIDKAPDYDVEELDKKQKKLQDILLRFKAARG